MPKGHLSKIAGQFKIPVCGINLFHKSGHLMDAESFDMEWKDSKRVGNLCKKCVQYRAATRPAEPEAKTSVRYADDATQLIAQRPTKMTYVSGDVRFAETIARTTGRVVEVIHDEPVPAPKSTPVEVRRPKTLQDFGMYETEGRPKLYDK